MCIKNNYFCAPNTSKIIINKKNNILTYPLSFKLNMTCWKANYGKKIWRCYLQKVLSARGSFEAVWHCKKLSRKLLEACCFCYYYYNYCHHDQYHYHQLCCRYFYFYYYCNCWYEMQPPPTTIDKGGYCNVSLNVNLILYQNPTID